MGNDMTKSGPRPPRTSSDSDSESDSASPFRFPCRGGCRFRRNSQTFFSLPTQTQKIKEKKKEAHTHTHSWRTWQTDNIMYIKKRHTHHTHRARERPDKNIMLFQWNMTLSCIRNYFRYSFAYGRSPQEQQEQLKRTFRAFKHSQTFPTAVAVLSEIPINGARKVVFTHFIHSTLTVHTPHTLHTLCTVGNWSQTFAFPPIHRTHRAC